MQTCNLIASIFGKNEECIKVIHVIKFYESDEYPRSCECLFALEKIKLLSWLLLKYGNSLKMLHKLMILAVYFDGLKSNELQLQSYKAKAKQV